MIRHIPTELRTPITIVALAPMTNLALLLRTYAECAAKIEQILFRGFGKGGKSAQASSLRNIGDAGKASAWTAVEVVLSADVEKVSELFLTMLGIKTLGVPAAGSTL